MVMLEWGSCGQMASSTPAGGRPTRPTTTSEGYADAPCLGYAFYAPPGAVPRARLFPSGPVSADAVLLTSLGVEADRAREERGHDAELHATQPDRRA